LTHPRYGVEKTYQAEVAGNPSPESLAKLERGVHLAEGFAHAKRVRVRRAHRHSATLEIVLDEGRNREVRRLLARVGHKVMKLSRVAIGSLRLGNLQPGESRPLAREEVEELYRAAQRKRKPGRAPNKSADRREMSRPQSLDESSGQPIIDRSVSLDTSDELEHLWAADSGDEQVTDLTSGHQMEPAVDLAKIVSDPSRRGQRTVIGAGRPRGRSDGQRQRKGRRNFQPRDRAGGRKRKQR